MAQHPSKPNKAGQPVLVHHQTEVTQETHFSGPLPHPSILAQYEAITPGFANRVITLAEQEAIHRRGIECRDMALSETIVAKDFSERRWGQVCAVIVALCVTAAGSFVAINSPDVAGQISGGFIGSGGIVALVSVFVLGRRLRAEDEKAKSEAKPG